MTALLNLNGFLIVMLLLIATMFFLVGRKASEDGDRTQLPVALAIGMFLIAVAFKVCGAYYPQLEYSYTSWIIAAVMIPLFIGLFAGAVPQKSY